MKVKRYKVSTQILYSQDSLLRGTAPFSILVSLVLHSSFLEITIMLIIIKKASPDASCCPAAPLGLARRLLPEQMSFLEELLLAPTL